MKRTVITIAFLCAVSAFTALAQDQGSKPPAATPAVAPKPYVRDDKGIELKAHEVLTDAEDAQHHKAYATAVTMPEVIAAAKAQYDAQNAAMLKADPAMGPVLGKLDAAFKRMRSAEAFATLTPAEKAQYDKAFGTAWRTPEVQAAVKAHHDVLHATMIKADPAVAPLIEKLAIAWDAARKEFYGKKKPAEPKQDKKP